MILRDAFQGVTRVFLDTAPVIYYVEATPGFAELARSTFNLIRQGQIQAIASPVTLSECINLPLRLGQVDLQQRFTKLLTNTNQVLMVDIDATVGRRSAELRIRYGLKLPDALQVATAIGASCEAFLTNDLALRRVTELRVLVLSELEV